MPSRFRSYHRQLRRPRAAKYGGDAAAGERRAGDLNRRFADWFYIISDADFQKLRLRRKSL